MTVDRSGPIITAKPLDQMTLAELRQERDHWNTVVSSSIEAGSAFQVAMDCRDACDAMMARRARRAEEAA